MCRPSVAHLFPNLILTMLDPFGLSILEEADNSQDLIVNYAKKYDRATATHLVRILFLLRLGNAIVVQYLLPFLGHTGVFRCQFFIFHLQQSAWQS